MINKQKIAIIACSVVGIIGLFMPWITMDMFMTKQSISGIEQNEGKILLATFLVAIVLSIVGDRDKTLSKDKFWITIVSAGVVPLVVFAYSYNKITNQMNEMSSGMGGLGGFGSFFGGGSSIKTEIGYGLYFTAIACVGLIATAFLMRKQIETEKKEDQKNQKIQDNNLV